MKRPGTGLDTQHAILPWLAEIDNRWSKVNKHNYDLAKYKKHSSYAYTVGNLLKSKQQLDDMIKQKQAEVTDNDDPDEGGESEKDESVL